MTRTTAKPPNGLKNAGKALWAAVQGEYELEPHEESLLLQLCRTADILDDLDAAIRRDGAFAAGQGLSPKVHPAVVEHRQQAIAYARLAAALRLPAGEEGDEDRRPQRRVGARGVYGLGGGTATRRGLGIA